MSTIIATTLSNGSVSVPTATVVNGSAKAWVNFNGTGTIAARDSFNVASLTDSGTGLYVVNFTNALADGNHSDVGSNANGFVLTNNNGSPTLGTATTALVNSKAANGSDFDSAFICASIQGDLA